MTGRPWHTFWAALLLVLALGSCGAVGSAGAGGGVGFWIGGPPGALAGAIGGLLGYCFTSIVAWWDNLWINAGHGGPPVPPPSPTNPLILWAVALLVLGFLFKLVWDADFREHVLGSLKTLPNVRRRRRPAHGEM